MAAYSNLELLAQVVIRYLRIDGLIWLEILDSRGISCAGHLMRVKVHAPSKHAQTRWTHARRSTTSQALMFDVGQEKMIRQCHLLTVWTMQVLPTAAVPGKCGRVDMSGVTAATAKQSI